MKKKKISISIGVYQGQFGDKKALEIAKELGADAVDFHLVKQDHRKEDCVYSKGTDSVRAYYQALRDYAKEIGIEIAQTHGRISGFKNIKEEDDALVENGRLDCIATASLGAKHCVMHTATTIHHGPNADRTFMHQLNFDMYRRILPYAKQEGIKIATETFGDAAKFNCIDFFGDINEFVEGYERVASIKEYADSVCVCMDPGHSNKASRFNNNPKPGDVIRQLGSSIEVLHLNDNDTLTDQHKPPMTGCIDWNDLFDALEEIGYDGYYNMEINLKTFGLDFSIEYGRFSIKLMRQILKNRYGIECLTEH